jgi:hypothetical protein
VERCVEDVVEDQGCVDGYVFDDSECMGIRDFMKCSAVLVFMAARWSC